MATQPRKRAGQTAAAPTTMAQTRPEMVEAPPTMAEATAPGTAEAPPTEAQATLPETVEAPPHEARTTPPETVEAATTIAQEPPLETAAAQPTETVQAAPIEARATPPETAEGQPTETVEAASTEAPATPSEAVEAQLTEAVEVASTAAPEPAPETAEAPATAAPISAVNLSLSDTLDPGMVGIKPRLMSDLLTTHRRNMEALAAASRLEFEGAQALARRNMEIMQQTMAELADAIKALAGAWSTDAKMAKRAELTKAAYERAVANMTELHDLARKINAEALTLLNRRFGEGMDEVKALIEKAGERR